MLLSDALSFVSSLLPGGRQVGSEYVCASIDGGEGRSFSVNLNTGIYSDFSNPGSGGPDLVSLYARVHHLNNGQAAKELDKRYGNGHQVTPPRRETHANKNRPAIVVPDGTPPPPNFDHPTHGTSSRVWTYRNGDGLITMFVARYDPPNARKVYCPWTFDGKRWNKYGWPDPQQLYGLDDLKLRKGYTVIIIVEGEKAADAARKFAPPHALVVTWPGGTQRWHKADWSPVYGQRIILWPDNDDPGHTCMQGLASALLPYCPKIKIFNVKDMPDDWDAADALESGWTIKDFETWTSTRLVDLPPRTAVAGNGNGHAPSPLLQSASTPPAQVSKPNGHARALDAHVLWMEYGLACNGQNMPHANANNARLVLERDPQMRELVWYDEFLRKFMTSYQGKPREWEDVDDTRLLYFLQGEMEIPKMSIESVRQSVREYAKRNPRHCVRQWIDGIVWDGVSRIDNVFEDHFGAERSPYVEAVCRTFFLSMLARIYRPGAKVDTMVVLEGDQGLRKSLGFEVIASPPWYTTQHESVGSKGFFEVLQGKLLVEIGEMDAFSRADITRVKDVVSSATDRFREPYTHYAADHPRQCVFGGTTNRDDWNKDETGARRFLPVTCRDRVDVLALAKHRDQYFAEAKVRLAPDSPWDEAKWHFSQGEDWWTTPEEKTKSEQRERLQEDPWQEHIERHIYYEDIGGQKYKRAAPLTQVTMNEILTSVLKIEVSRIQRADERRVGACLTHIGWDKSKGRVDEEQFGKIWKPRPRS